MILRLLHRLPRSLHYPLPDAERQDLPLERVLGYIRRRRSAKKAFTKVGE